MTGATTDGHAALRVYTDDEVRDQFLTACAARVRYWLAETRAPDPEAKLTGLVHSILTIIDGGTLLPGFALCPDPHADDEAFYREQRENWYPSGPDHDIAGGLHERWPTAARAAGLTR